MRKNKKLYDYTPLIPPISKLPINFTKTETQEYYKWFMAHIDERSDYLRERIAQDMCISLDLLDFSLESLKLVWKWFLDVADLDKKSIFEPQKRSKENKSNSFIHDFLSSDNDLHLSVFSYYVVRDIGMYVGKMFTSCYSNISWSVKTKPKNYISVNEPLLVGFIDDNLDYPKPFYPDFEPIGCVYTCALNLIDNTSQENDLYNLCAKFCSMIPQNGDEGDTPKK